MKTVYFVRHGESQANADGLIAGSKNDSPLTQKGLEQASATAEVLRAIPIDLIISSPLLRAKDTAKRIAEELGYKDEIHTEPLLTERDFGAASGQPWDVGFQAIDAGTIDDVETLEEIAERMQQALDALKMLSGGHVLVVGHGGSERMMRTLYEGKPYQNFLETGSLHNGQVREYSF